MRLQSFHVQWFKNLRRPIELQELGVLNVIHGTNNVGKSNLVEAIELYFILLEQTCVEMLRTSPMAWRGNGELSRTYARSDDSSTSEHQLPQTFPLDARVLGRWGHPAADVFNLRSPRPISLAGCFVLDPRDFETRGQEPSAREVEIALTLTRESNQLLIGIERFVVDGEIDVLAQEPGSTLAHRLLPVIARSQFDPNILNCSLVRADRSATPRFDRDSTGPWHKNPRALIPDSLCLELYDVKQSRETHDVALWRLFEDSLSRFANLLGPGTFTPVYDRQREHASLVFDNTDNERIPAHLLGAGVQQLVGLIGRLLMTRAAILALEEPELNLRYTEQKKLGEALEALARGNAGPSQIFVTSHSPAFESGTHFYAMRDTEGGPVVERRPVDQVRDLLEYDTPLSPRTGAHAPLCYVSSEGLVLIPEGVRRALGVESGGGVRFIRNKRSEHYEILSTEQFVDLLSDTDDPTDDGERGPG